MLEEVKEELDLDSGGQAKVDQESLRAVEEDETERVVEGHHQINDVVIELGHLVVALGVGLVEFELQGSRSSRIKALPVLQHFLLRVLILSAHLVGVKNKGVRTFH